MAKKPKNEFASDAPFSLAVCNRIRWCVGQRSKVVAERAEAFQKRDSMRSMLGTTLTAQLKGQATEADVNDAKVRVFDAERNIEELQHAISFFGKTLTETVQNADKPMLDGLYDEMPTPTALPLPGVEPPAPPKKDPAQVMRENLDKKSKAMTPLPPVVVHTVEGEAQHMAASVNELDLPELQKGRLIKGGLTTVAQLAALVDGPGFVQAHLEERCSCTEKQAFQIVTALNAYRKKHRKAAAQVEQEAAVGA